MKVKILKLDERHVFYGTDRNGNVFSVFVRDDTQSYFFFLTARKALDKLIVTVKKNEGW
jgi:hypothetical protein